MMHMQLNISEAQLVASDQVYESYLVLEAGVVYYDKEFDAYFVAPHEHWAELASAKSYEHWRSHHQHLMWLDESAIEDIAYDHYSAVCRDFGSEVALTCCADDFDDTPLRDALKERHVGVRVAKQEWSDQEWKDYIGFEIRKRLDEQFRLLAGEDTDS